ncbi:MAG: hydantoinase B/oxoprolinase family protein [Trueperaceae bacterium]|nr:MAG: hydantoinase B/oxoprolinase family protein [Trueperaceae bacterium]
MTTRFEPVVTRAGADGSRALTEVDPITTEIVRHGLNSAANQMKQALIRTAFSPIIYEVLDFAVAIYDDDVRLLAQAPSLPIFMGTMSFCVEAAVAAVGGRERLEPGDIILYNDPYGSGSHPQDAALIMPVFLDENLVGYTAIKAHWLDIGAKDPYATDTVDVFQEGVIFPGVKLYSRGQRVDDVYRTVLANSRMPAAVEGDIRAEITGVRTGGEALLRLIRRYGLVDFKQAVEHMFDHAEATVRRYFEEIPDGQYRGFGMMDDNGVEPDPVPFEVVLEVKGSTVQIDYSNAPGQQRGPINCPLPSTVSASRVAISMLAGAGEAPNEGHMRPVEIKTRPGTLFHPLPPAPCFLCGWPTIQAIEVIYHAISQALPHAVTACSGGDICGLTLYGVRKDTGEPWTDGSPHPVGQGGHIYGDGGTMMHVSESATRFPATEVWESKNPIIMEKVELAQDSCGAGEHRGGLGIDFFFHALDDFFITAAVERTKTAPWGLLGGAEGRPNAAAVRYPNGERTFIGKATRLPVPKGATLEYYTGGGGGYGEPAEREEAAIRKDLREGYLSESYVRQHFPQLKLEEGS